jgi:putative transposase
VLRGSARGRLVFGERYHAHELKTPRETRAALLYVLQNWAKHGSGGDHDPRSSARWFDGWAVPPPSELTLDARIVATPRTWLVTVGWRRHGLLRPGERPGRMAVSFLA